MKKLLGILLSLSMIISCFGVVAFAEENYDIDKLKFGEPIEVGAPIKSTYILKCAISEYNGIPVAGTATSGTPSRFNIVNLNDGSLIKSFNVPVGETFWVVEADSKGNIYFGGYIDARLYRWSPKTNEVEDLGKIPDTKALISMDFDGRDNPLLGTFPSGSIIKYDVMSKRFVSYGKQAVNDQYLKSMAYYDNRIYFGKYSGDLHMLDLKSGKRTDIPTHPKYVKTDGVGKLTAAGKYMVGIIYLMPQGETKFKNVLVMYDMDKNEWLDFTIEDVEGQYVSPLKDGKVYYNMKKDSQIYALDLETKESTPTGLYAHLMRGDGFANITEGEAKGLCYVNAEYEGNITLYNFDTGKKVTYKGKLDGSPANIRDMEFGNDGRLYVGEMMGSKGAQWDLAKNETNIFPTSQVEGMTAIGDNIVMGTYGKAIIYNLDTTKPINDSNPYIAGPLGDGQDRPFAVKPIDDELVMMGTISTYGELGGALSIYNTKTHNKEVYRNLVQDQSVLGLAYKDGIIYGSTTVAGGLNTKPTKTKAEIFKFDIETGNLIKSVVPDVKGASRDIGAWGELTFGKDGNLWAYSIGYLIALNPETLEVVKQISLEEAQPKVYGQYWTPFNLRFLDQGFMVFSDNGKISVVDTKTGRLVKTGRPANSGMVVGPDNNIYYIKGSRVFMVPVSYGDNDPKTKLDNKVTLFIGSNKALKGATETRIDFMNKDIKPVVENGRTLLPLRFLSEIFGAEVLWDDATKTATVKLNGKTVEVPIGNNVIKIDGVEKTIDVPAQVVSGRTLLPLRALVESLDKSVVWDDRGLIVVCEKDKDKEVDNEVKNYLISKF